jgi:Choline/Carnitine o-acyltransferase
MSRLSSWHRQIRVMDSTIRRLGGTASPSLSSLTSSSASLSNSPKTRPLLLVQGSSHSHRLFQQSPTSMDQKFRFHPVSSSRFFSSDPQQQNWTIKPWNTSFVESNGDYRDESFLEDWIGGPLYENQHKLPKLPVPTIDETLKRFLPTALPLARSKEEELTLMEACKAFPEQATVLQERLLARRNGEMKDSSWLQLWWNQVREREREGKYGSSRTILNS